MRFVSLNYSNFASNIYFKMTENVIPVDPAARERFKIESEKYLFQNSDFVIFSATEDPNEPASGNISIHFQSNIVSYQTFQKILDILHFWSHFMRC